MNIPDSKKEKIIRAKSEVLLIKGQNIHLEVVGGKKNFKMRFIGVSRSPSNALQENIPTRFLEVLAKFSESRLSNSEFKLLLKTLRSLPDSIKAALPELKGLEKLLSRITQLNDRLLKSSVETSGVLFETRLKFAVLREPGTVLQSLLALQAEGDLKALLLRLKRSLKDRDVINILRQAGFKESEIANTLERFIRNIEFFQLMSKAHDMLYTFLPVLWDGLKDSEFMLRKHPDNGKDSYTCDINLDLESLGKLSISVTVSDKNFYITFLTERPGVDGLINSQRLALERRFATQGLSLRMINIHHKQNIAFGQAQRHGINLKL